jgi:hypothetical protein
MIDKARLTLRARNECNSCTLAAGEVTFELAFSNLKQSFGDRAENMLSQSFIVSYPQSQIQKARLD